VSELVIAFVQRIAAEYDVTLTDKKAEEYLIENTAFLTRNWQTNDPIAELEAQLRKAFEEGRVTDVLPRRNPEKAD